LQHIGTSRRDIIRLLGAAGALGPLQLLSAKEARADDSRGDGGCEDEARLAGARINPSLLDALRFQRKNRDDPAIVFSPKNGLLVGFGDNLYHSDLSTARLFVKGRQVLKSSVTTEDVPENIAVLAPGTTGTMVQTTQDHCGRLTTATITVESIRDVPDDFLVTGKTEGDRYTGAFFRITTLVGTPNGSIGTLKTTYNLLTHTFPLDLNVIPGPLFNVPSDSIVDVDAVLLSGIAAQMIAMEVGAPAFIPTDLQQDFPWRKIFRHIVVTFVGGPGAEAVYLLATEPSVRSAAGTALLLAFAAALSGILGNRADAALMDMYNKITEPPPLIP
jgi:hypothetical protein